MDEDNRRYLDTLKEQTDKHGCLIHALVLMINHVHRSSYHVNADGKQSYLITPNEQYLRLGHTDDLPRDAYHGLF